MDKTPVRGAKENPRLRPPRGKRIASLRTHALRREVGGYVPSQSDPAERIPKNQAPLWKDVLGRW